MKVNKKQHLKMFVIVFFFFAGLFIYGKRPNLPCKSVKKGSFYFYGKTTGVHYKIIRNDSLQMEVNRTSNDTSFWKIDWIDDCSYKLKYLYGGGSTVAGIKDFLAKHTTFIQIREVQPRFYVFKVALDSLNSAEFDVDTAWMKAK